MFESFFTGYLTVGKTKLEDDNDKLKQKLIENDQTPSIYKQLVQCGQTTDCELASSFNRSISIRLFCYTITSRIIVTAKFGYFYFAFPNIKNNVENYSNIYSENIRYIGHLSF